MIKKAIYILLLALIGSAAAYAVPAKRGMAQIHQTDGSVLTIERHGDEFFHYTTTSDGYHITQMADGLYYYYQNSATKAAPAVRAYDPGSRSAIERQYLQNISKGVDEGYRARGMAQTASWRASSRANARSLTEPTTRANSMAPRGLVIVVQFSDVKLQSKHTKASFTDLLNKKGYSANGGTGSAKDYCEENSKGRYSPTFDVGAIVTLPHPMSYYGENIGGDGRDKRPKQMVSDACNAAKDLIDFSKYDTDGDGKVDNVFIYYAGYNEAENGPENSVWPHRWALDIPLSMGGVTVSDYACTSELRDYKGSTLAGIGTFMHEFGHVLGLPDLYDTDNEDGGQSRGLYDMSIMSAGSYLNDGCTPPYYSGLERSLLGWGTLKQVSAGTLTLGPIETDNDAWMIATTNKTGSGEFYVLESRGNKGWDRYLGGYGLLVYHIDQSGNIMGGVTAYSRWKNNTINAVLGAECAKFVEGAGRYSGNPMDIFYPGSADNTRFLGSSYGGVDNRGVAIPFELTSIAATAEGVTTLNVRAALPTTEVTGRVMCDGVPISGAMVSLTTKQIFAPSKAITNLQRAPYKASAPTQLIASTNPDGSFTINSVPQGEYIINIDKQGYDVLAENINVGDTWQSRTFVLEAELTRLCETLSWLRGPVLYTVTAPRPPKIAVLWDATDLTAMVGDTVSAIKVHTGISTTMKVEILSGGKSIFSKDIAATTPYGVTTVRIPKNLGLTIPSSGQLRIELQFGSAVQFIGVDDGPAEKGKSDLISYDDGKTWQFLSTNLNYNFAVMVEKYKRTSDLSTPTITVAEKRQRSIILTLRSTDSNIKGWVVRHKAASDQTWKENSVDATSFATNIGIGGLMPSTGYMFELRTLFDNVLSSAAQVSATTTDLTAPFAAIDGIKGSYTVGQMFSPILTNLPEEPTSVLWSVDGTPIDEKGVSFTMAGRYKITCIITYSDLSTEVINRTVTVTAL